MRTRDKNYEAIKLKFFRCLTSDGINPIAGKMRYDKLKYRFVESLICIMYYHYELTPHHHVVFCFYTVFSFTNVKKTLFLRARIE